MNPTHKKVDYIIVGQGLAGTLLAYFLRKQQQEILVLDKAYPRSATSVAAGIINPITGRRFVKSWMIDALIPLAEQTYADLEKLLGRTFYHKKNILRTLFNHGEESDWLGRTTDEGYAKYEVEQSSLGAYENHIHPVFTFMELQHCAQVAVGELMLAYRGYLDENGCYQKEDFDYSQVQFLGDEQLVYKGIKAKKIIFCEGDLATQNPYFGYLPYNGAKGETLIVKIPNANFEKMFKHRIFIVPLENDLYWCGATNQNKAPDDLPSDEAFQFIEKRLKDILKVPFEIVEHRSAIRPTVKDRRPFLGVHPEYAQLFIFNGLGAKGASLGPYWANEMVQHLLQRKPIPKEVNINRFQ